MGKYLQTCVEIGGVILKKDVEGLIEAINDEGLGLDWGDPGFEPETEADLIAAMDKTSGVLRLCGECNYGQLDSLGDWLSEHDIEHDVSSDGDSAEFGGTVQHYRRELTEHPQADSEGYVTFGCAHASDTDPQVRAVILWDAVDLLNKGDAKDALAKLQEAPPRVPPLGRLTFK